ncbi:glycoside hydrolase family 3 N-terminal domain-containing protein [Oceanicella actignis]|uniref:beta-N-acetylhexosaminidase n=1 Tax=Oceanicella actignis TaxID=1189325 RepID=A0A1M7SA75_9RHOB|nr:glycoside hydrolase family 3 N-terminal domain-containing protein [Oceanicella actignis]SET29873.1 beta-N-acetylhexosaminidase [Oceanicella actignis]SHN55381.1 beta-N-acetylhexosaminidase [Oceanicella actignis]
MSTPRAVIFGLSGPELTADERAFFAEADPWGFILFARNVAAPDQLRRLTGALREAVGREAPILIDQEGGRVARMRAPHWREWPRLPDFCARLPDAAVLTGLRLRHRLIAHELRAVGIDVNCAPMVDVARPDADPIIADRALGDRAGPVARRGRAAAEALLEGGVLPVVKHVPGYGRATLDAHRALPVTDAPLDALEEDFAPFRALADMPMMMTAHMIYRAIDPERCATVSPDCIALIRRRIGFDGLLMTDDIGMEALSGPVPQRAAEAIAAGCDVALHCNGDLAQMRQVAARTPLLAGDALRRAEAALARRRAPAPFDPDEADRRHAYLNQERADV